MNGDHHNDERREIVIHFGNKRRRAFETRMNELETNTNNNSMNSLELTLLEQHPVVQLFKNFPAFHRTRGFITMFTRAL
jgi:hypothetical protein